MPTPYNVDVYRNLRLTIHSLNYSPHLHRSLKPSTIQHGKSAQSCDHSGLGAGRFRAHLALRGLQGAVDVVASGAQGGDRKRDRHALPRFSGGRQPLLSPS